jgi:hypothetical protein
MMNIEYLKSKTDEELEELLGRATGKTTRLVDRVVQEFFTQPMGTKIYAYDHYGTRQADQLLLKTVAKRLEAEHHARFHLGGHDGCYIVRDTPTLRELILKEFEKRENDE